MTSSEIRASFLKYFERHGHRIVPSSPLVPHDDPTLLFTNAGMNQFKDVFLGRETRDYTRATTAQKCMRVSGKHNDLDNVGPSFRHHTFFEMLGNFSFGDYFKRDAIPFAWTLLTDEWKLPTGSAVRHRLPGRVRRAARRRGVRHLAQVPAGRAHRRARRGRQLLADGRHRPVRPLLGDLLLPRPELPCAEEAAGRTCRGLECSCDRYIEIWNNVFMEFDRQADGTLKPLPAPSIDTGMGLERVTAVLQGKLSNYDTDSSRRCWPRSASAPARRTAGRWSRRDVSMRVVADHMRAMTFLIADGVVPSNEWRGYVLRKIMRRAMRHGKRLGISRAVPPLARRHGGATSSATRIRSCAPAAMSIVQVIRSEEERFDAVLTDGLPRLEEVLDSAAAGGGVVPATSRSGCTTRTACRATSSRT